MQVGLSEVTLTTSADRGDSDRRVYYASVYSRALAKTIDLTCVAVCFVPLDILFGTSFVVHRNFKHEHAFASAAVVFFVLFLYESLLICSSRQATFGKAWTGLLVEDLSGRRLTLRHALVRSLLQFVSVYSLGLGYLIAVITPHRQTLHDFVAGSRVVYGSIR
jgi:uncharacterized RDD family membrane protein YckC